MSSHGISKGVDKSVGADVRGGESSRAQRALSAMVADNGEQRKGAHQTDRVLGLEPDRR
jgi:hypothetical protein